DLAADHSGDLRVGGARSADTQECDDANGLPRPPAHGQTHWYLLPRDVWQAVVRRRTRLAPGTGAGRGAATRKPVATKKRKRIAGARNAHASRWRADANAAVWKEWERIDGIAHDDRRLMETRVASSRVIAGMRVRQDPRPVWTGREVRRFATADARGRGDGHATRGAAASASGADAATGRTRRSRVS